MPPKKRCTFGVCCQAIVKGKDESLFCGGECQQWLCAGVPAEVNKTHLNICSPRQTPKKAIFVLSNADQSNTIKDI